MEEIKERGEMEEEKENERLWVRKRRGQSQKKDQLRNDDG